MGLFGFLFGSAVPLEQRRISLEDQSPLGAYLTPEELLELAKVCSGAKFRPGSSLPESPFYVVVSGQVEVRDPNGSVLCTKYPGSFFTRRAGLVRGRGAMRKSAVRTSQEGEMVQRSSIVKGDLDDESFTKETPLTRIVGGKVGGTVLWVRNDRLEAYLNQVASRDSAEVVNSISHSLIPPGILFKGQFFNVFRD